MDTHAMDVQISEELRKEFEGVATHVTCCLCKGAKRLAGKRCPNCKGKGSYKLIQFPKRVSA